MSTAPNLLDAAAKHMRDRAAAYDKPDGERAMLRTVTAFNALTGSAMTEREGWVFMLALKLARFYQNPSVPHQDSIEDAIAYAALWGESAGIYEATEPMPATDGWIEWEGGECPVPDKVVRWRTRDGSEGQYRAGMVSGWLHANPHPQDIVAYRVIP